LGVLIVVSGGAGAAVPSGEFQAWASPNDTARRSRRGLKLTPSITTGTAIAVADVTVVSRFPSPLIVHRVVRSSDNAQPL